MNITSIVTFIAGLIVISAMLLILAGIVKLGLKKKDPKIEPKTKELLTKAFLLIDMSPEDSSGDDSSETSKIKELKDIVKELSDLLKEFSKLSEEYKQIAVGLLILYVMNPYIV